MNDEGVHAVEDPLYVVTDRSKAIDLMQSFLNIIRSMPKLLLSFFY